MFANVNLNDHVKARLTERGLLRLRADHADLRRLVPKLPEFAPPKLDDDGYATFQIWELIRNFGDMIHMGCDPPFDLNIKIEIRESP